MAFPLLDNIFSTPHRPAMIANIMKIEDYLDVEAFKKSMTPPDKSVFRTWSQTALEINREKHEDISRLLEIYLLMPKTKLLPSHIVVFVEMLLNALPSDEDRKQLIRAIALPFRKFEL